MQLGTGFITLHDVSGRIIEKYEVTNSPHVSFANNQIIIRPSDPFAMQASYGMTIEMGAVIDDANHIWAEDGYSYGNINQLLFKVAESDGLPHINQYNNPTLNSFGY